MRIIEGRHLGEMIRSASIWTQGSKSVEQNERKCNTMGAGWFKGCLTRRTATTGLSFRVRQGALCELMTFSSIGLVWTWLWGDREPVRWPLSGYKNSKFVLLGQVQDWILGKQCPLLLNSSHDSSLGDSFCKEALSPGTPKEERSKMEMVFDP